MNPPLPSFFKIRIVLIISVLIIFIFLVGIAKQAFSWVNPETGECYAIYYRRGSSIDTNVCLTGFKYEVLDGMPRITRPSSPVYGEGQRTTFTATWFRKSTEGDWLLVANDSISSYGCVTDYQPAVAQYPESGPGLDPNSTTTYDERLYESCNVSCADEETQLQSDCGLNNYTIDPVTCEGSCIDPCWQQREAANTQCGENHFSMDPISCEYNCSPCDMVKMNIEIRDCKEMQIGVAIPNYETCTVDCDMPNCMDEWQALKESCGSAGIQNFSSITCQGLCNQNCDRAYSQLSYVCGKIGIGNFDWNTCEGSCDGCKNLISQCEYECEGRGGVYSDDCFVSTSGTIVNTCTCMDERPTTEGPEDPTAADAQTDPTTPGTTPDDPDADDPGTAPTTSTDEWLKSIKHSIELGDAKNLQQLEAQTELLNKNVHNQGEMIKLQENIARNLATAVTNQGRMVEVMSNMAYNYAKSTEEISKSLNQLGTEIGENLTELGNEIGEDLNRLGDEIGEDLDQLGQKLDDLQGAIEGEGENQGALPYDVPETYSVEQHNWGDRTSQFLTDMRSTGLFSVPTEFFGNIPGGGSPEFVIESGDTFGGTHTLSLADFSTALLSLRAVIQLAFMWIAVRIVTMKR